MGEHDIYQTTENEAIDFKVRNKKQQICLYFSRSRKGTIREQTTNRSWSLYSKKIQTCIFEKTKFFYMAIFVFITHIWFKTAGLVNCFLA